MGWFRSLLLVLKGREGRLVFGTLAIGILLFVGGAAGLVYATRASLGESSPLAWVPLVFSLGALALSQILCFVSLDRLYHLARAEKIVAMLERWETVPAGAEQRDGGWHPDGGGGGALTY